MLNGKATIVILTQYLTQYFLNLKSLETNVKVELDLSNYATKGNLENATGVNASKFTKKVELAGLKSRIDKLDIDKLEKLPSCLNSLISKLDKLDIVKLETTTVDLSNLSNIVKSDVVKKSEVYWEIKTSRLSNQK